MEKQNSSFDKIKSIMITGLRLDDPLFTSYVKNDENFGIFQFLDFKDILTLITVSKKFKNLSSSFINIKYLHQADMIYGEYLHYRNKFNNKKTNWLQIRNNLDSETQYKFDEEFKTIFYQTEVLNKEEQLKQLENLYKKGAGIR